MSTIYCDESGFTGSHLSSDDQPFFIYASVVMEPDDAAAWVSTLRTTSGLPHRELKGSQLVRTHPALVNEILQSLEGRASVLIVDKHYALAGKFFDLLLEPVLRPLMPTLREYAFQHFVITALYGYFKTSEQTADQLVRTFEQGVRDHNPDRLIALLSSWPADADIPGMLTGIQTLCQKHIAQIRQTIADLEHIGGGGPWILDMSAPALYSTLRHWGQDGMPLRVYCDRNKPLQAQADLLNLMVYQWPRQTLTIDGVSAPTYWMVDPIHFVDSKQHPGIQLADVLASAFAAASRAPEERGDTFLEQHAALLHPQCMLVNADHLDLSLLPAYTNRMIFDELVRRTAVDEDLCADLSLVVAQAHADFPEWRDILKAHQTTLL